MNNNLMFSSFRDDWGTPLDLFKTLDNEFHFTLDPCSNDSNFKVARHFTISDDGLFQSWRNEIVFCNPPYGRNIYKWIKKSYTEAVFNNAVVVLLIPARTDTKWFHEFIYNIAEIRFLKGRIKFDGASYGAPFPSMICIFNFRGKL